MDVLLFKKKRLKKEKKEVKHFSKKEASCRRPLKCAALRRSARRVSQAPSPYRNWAMIRLQLFTEPDRYKCAAAR